MPSETDSILLCGGNDRLGVAQLFHPGVLNEALGADRGALAAVGALTVVDLRQVVGDGDGAAGAGLHALAAAEAADGAGTEGESAN